MSYVSLLLLLPERYTQRVFSIYFLYKPACEPFDVPPCTCDIRWFASLFLFLKDLLILIWFFRNWNFQKAEHALDVQGWHFLVATYFLDRRETISFSNKSFFCFCFLPSQKLSPLCRCFLREIKLNGIYIKKNTFKGTLRNIREKVSCVCCLMLE